MNEKDLKKIVMNWAKDIGKDQALVKMVTVGISPSMAHKLIAGNYESKVGRLVTQALITAMKRAS